LGSTYTPRAESRPARYAVLLRGVNLVRRNRISMPELRSALVEEAFRDVATYVQSGNIVLSSRESPDRVAHDVKQLIKRRFGLDLIVLVRSRAELAEVVRRNPLAAIAVNPRRYIVTFMSTDLPAQAAASLQSLAGRQEESAIIGREVYSWHPDSIGLTPLWERLADKALGVQATSRNWTTVTTLPAMAAGARLR
jgi:uncharacterized protein (DUF1697 family)